MFTDRVLLQRRSFINVYPFSILTINFNRISKGGDYTIRLYTYFLIFVHRYSLQNAPIFCCCFKVSASWWPCSKNFLNPHVVNFSVCLFNVFFLDRTYAKIGQWPRNFDMCLIYICLHMKNVIVSYIDFFTGCFKNFNALIFSVLF